MTTYIALLLAIKSLKENSLSCQEILDKNINDEIKNKYFRDEINNSEAAISKLEELVIKHAI